MVLGFETLARNVEVLNVQRTGRTLFGQPKTTGRRQLRGEERGGIPQGSAAYDCGAQCRATFGSPGSTTLIVLAISVTRKLPGTFVWS